MDLPISKNVFLTFCVIFALFDSSFSASDGSIDETTGVVPMDKSSFGNSTVVPIEQPNNSSSPPTEFPHNETLDPNGLFQLRWKFDNDTVTFRYEVATKGWAGLGFSPNGGMAGADLVVVWVDEAGKPHISDRHASENGFPPADATQDYKLIECNRNASHLAATFSRRRNTCDKEDWAFTDDTTRVIYSANDAIPESEDNFQKHSISGTKSIHLFDKKRGGDDVNGPPMENITSLEFRVSNVRIPDNITTTYWCEVLRVPTLGKKVHIIKTEPVINVENYHNIHHMLVYLCANNMSEYVGKGTRCFGPNVSEGDADIGDGGSAFGYCNTQVLALWAVGGRAVTYPDNLGMPLYNDGQDMYVMMEVHYDNSYFMKGKIDNSGIRIWVTEQLRPIETDHASLGLWSAADEQLIPPGQKEFTSYSYCSAECTNKFPPDGITVIGGLLHTHLTGRKVRLLHFRNGKQLPAIMSDDHYDFQYQDARRLMEPVKILPGDELVVQCVYSTLNRNTTVFGGASTHDEMCLVLLEYYPAVFHGFTCNSSPDKRQIFSKIFGLELSHNGTDPSAGYQALAPGGENKKLSLYIKQDFVFNWTEEKVQQYQEAVRNADYNVYCIRPQIHKEFDVTRTGTNDSGLIEFFVQHGFPNVTEPLVVQDVCASNQTDEGDYSSGSNDTDVHNIPTLGAGFDVGYGTTTAAAGTETGNATAAQGTEATNGPETVNSPVPAHLTEAASGAASNRGYVIGVVGAAIALLHNLRPIATV